jgi:hypothetical protein
MPRASEISRGPPLLTHRQRLVQRRRLRKPLGSQLSFRGEGARHEVDPNPLPLHQRPTPYLARAVLVQLAAGTQRRSARRSTRVALQSAPGRNRTSARGLGNRCSRDTTVSPTARAQARWDDCAALWVLVTLLVFGPLIQYSSGRGLRSGGIPPAFSVFGIPILDPWPHRGTVDVSAISASTPLPF